MKYRLSEIQPTQSSQYVILVLRTISKAGRVNSLLPAFLVSTAESVGCLQYLSLRALKTTPNVSRPNTDVTTDCQKHADVK